MTFLARKRPKPPGDWGRTQRRASSLCSHVGMRNITKTLIAAATTTALLLAPIHSAHASQLSSSSSSRTPVEPVPIEPEEPVDDRPVAVRLVGAAETHFVAEGFTIDPKLTAIAQEYGDHRGRLQRDEMETLMEEAGYTSWGVSTSYGYSFHREADIREFQDGTHFMENYHYTNVGVAVSKPSYDGRTYLVIVEAGVHPEEPRVIEQ